MKLDAANAVQAKKNEVALGKLRAKEAKWGKIPEASPWDGITPEVNEFLKENLKDYASFSIIHCSEVRIYANLGPWAQRVSYRAKNSFGALELSDQVFVIKFGKVIKVVGE